MPGKKQDATESLKRTLKELVALDTTSHLPNGPLIDLLEARVKALGFACERLSYTDAEGKPKTNLLARAGPAEGTPELALVGHTDCVPYDPDWKEALTLTERDGRLYGRGSADTKSFITCALTAAGSVDLKALKKPLLLIFTADEEIGLVGARQLVTAKKGQARFAIVGEPTSLQPVRGHKGYCLAEVEVTGKEGHSAYPASGVSAIFGAARLLGEIERYAKGPLREQTSADFEPPYTTVNVGVVRGGRAKNVIPDSCRFVLEWRPIPSQATERVFRDVEALIQKQQQADPTFHASASWIRTDTGVDTQVGSPLVKFLEAQSGKSSTTVSFATEAPQLTQLGAEAVVFGPGDIKVAHQNGEFVPVAELVRAEEILRAAIQHFCL